MTRFTLPLIVLTVGGAAVTCLPAAPPPKQHATVIHRAVAFDMSAPLEQFIPDKAVVIHPAVLSPPVRQGAMQGPNTALSATPPTPPAARGGGAGRGRGGAGRAGGPPADSASSARPGGECRGRRRGADGAGQARRHRAAGRF